MKISGLAVLLAFYAVLFVYMVIFDVAINSRVSTLERGIDAAISRTLENE
jgi:hypothetical protein